MSYQPSPEADGARFGVRVERMEYPPGTAGVRLSIQEIARRIREGGRSPSMQQFAEGIVRAAGYPPSKHLGQREAAQILLDYVRANVRYRPDPPGVEFTKGAAITLCVPGAQMCIPVEDCDGLVVALGSLMMAYGIHVHVLKQAFAGSNQEHVLIEFQDERGNWIPADPSVPSEPVGWKSPASDEQSVDPLDLSQLQGVSGHEVEFVGVGGVSGDRALVQTAGGWREYAHGEWWVHDGRAGSEWRSLGAPDAFLLPGYQLVTDGKIRMGLRYRIQFIVAQADLMSSNVSSNQDWFKRVFGDVFLVESVAPDGSVVGGDQSWTMQGLARNDASISFVHGSDFMNATVVNVAVQSSSVVAPPPTVQPPPTQKAPAPGSSGVSVGQVAAIGTGLAIVGGIGVALWRRRKAA